MKKEINLDNLTYRHVRNEFIPVYSEGKVIYTSFNGRMCDKLREVLELINEIEAEDKAL